MALVGFATKGGIISGVLFLLLAVVVSPLREKVLQFIPEQFRKKWITVIVSIVLFIVGTMSFPTSDNTKAVDDKQIEAEVLRIIPEKTLEDNKKDDSGSDKLKDSDLVKVSDEKCVNENKKDSAGVLNTSQKSDEKKTTEAKDDKPLDEDKNNIVTTEISPDQAAKEENKAKTDIDEKTDALPKDEQSNEVVQQEQENKVSEEAEGIASEPAASTEVVSDTSNVENVQEETSQGGGGNGDNFNTYDIPEQQNTEETYVLNTNTMKFHYPSCKSVKKIKPENYATSSASRDELISQGYDPCGNCHP